MKRAIKSAVATFMIAFAREYAWRLAKKMLSPEVPSAPMRKKRKVTRVSI